MDLNRRIFMGGAAVAASAPALGAVIDSGATDPVRKAALAAIADYMEAHRRQFGLPAMGLVVQEGDRVTLIRSGPRDYAGKTPLDARDLWQIGSISKSFVAVICLQLAEEGKLDLEGDIRKALPEAPLPSGAPFTVRGLLDHTTGLPDDAPAFPADGSKLWRGFEPGAHWSYSNTAYELIGRMIERIEGKPLGPVIEARIMKPLAMADSRGAITWGDQPRYPASWQPLYPDQPLKRAGPLAPAPFGVVTFGAGCVAATLPDMAKYLRWMAAAGRGKGAPLLSDAMAKLWLAKPVVQDPGNPAETYGLGLMHRQDEGRRLLHHTGGMICFSSSFHVDPAADIGCYASTPLNSAVGYRPRLVTRFAVAAIRHAAAGQPLPAPPPLAMPVAKPGDYAGRFADADRSFAVEATPELALVDGAARLPMEQIAPDMFVAGGRFGHFPLLGVREGGKIVAFDWGRHRFALAGAKAAPLAASTPRMLAREGHYQSDDPWVGGVTIVARGGRLYADGVQQLTEIGEDVWRASDDDWNPERLRFGGYVDGKPMWLNASGRILERRDG